MKYSTLLTPKLLPHWNYFLIKNEQVLDFEYKIAHTPSYIYIYNGMPDIRSLVCMESTDQRSQSNVILQKIIAILLRRGSDRWSPRKKTLSFYRSNSTKEAVAEFFYDKHVISLV